MSACWLVGTQISEYESYAASGGGVKAVVGGLTGLSHVCLSHVCLSHVCMHVCMYIHVTS
jgi:hypothetical protein